MHQAVYDETDKNDEKKTIDVNDLLKIIKIFLKNFNQTHTVKGFETIYILSISRLKYRDILLDKNDKPLSQLINSNKKPSPQSSNIHETTILTQ